jgi:hypothetical protein
VGRHVEEMVGNDSLRWFGKSMLMCAGVREVRGADCGVVFEANPPPQA